jgi:hypothetical protein
VFQLCSPFSPRPRPFARRIGGSHGGKVDGRAGLLQGLRLVEGVRDFGADLASGAPAADRLDGRDNRLAGLFGALGEAHGDRAAAAPLERPERMPSSRLRRQAYSTASSLLIWSIERELSANPCGMDKPTCWYLFNKPTSL